jgi:polysaccharide pyruvyl transferase WcaK-like protein
LRELADLGSPDSNGTHDVTRIGLLTPYNGRNLGDGTIQTAVIENLRRKDPDLEFLGITMDPEDTIRRHQIPAVPITGLAVSSYSKALVLKLASGGQPPPAPVEVSTPSGAPPRGGVREIVKRLPLVGPALRGVVRAGRWLRLLGPELRHLRESYRAVRGLDLLLVSGGGQLDEEFGGPWGHPYVLFRWAMLARLARTPLAFASVGAGYLDRPLSRFFVRHALAAAVYRSYRDPGTAERLAPWTFTRGDPHFPDLAFSLPVSAPLVGGDSESPGIIGISPIVYGHAAHWPTKRPALYENYSRRLAEFAQWLLGRGHKLLLFRTSSADRVAIADLKARLAELAGPDALRGIVEPEVESVPQFFREVAAADCVVASRLHGVTMSHMLGKPVLAISFDRKVDAHMESMEQMQYRLSIGEFTVADLIDRFTALRQDGTQERRIVMDHVADFRRQLDAQYEVLHRLATPPGPPVRSPSLAGSAP